MRDKIRKFLSEKRHILIAMAIVIVLAIVFKFYSSQIYAAEGKGRSEYLYHSAESETVEVGQKGIRMRFMHDGTLYSLGFVFHTSENLSGVLQLRVFSSADEVISIVTKDAAEIRVGEIFGFTFLQPLERSDGIFEIELTAETSGVLLAAVGGGIPDGWQLYNGEHAVDGALVMTGEVDRLGDFISVFYWSIAVFICLSIAGMYLLSRNKKIPLHRLYMVSILLLGILFCFLLPPYSSPDEQFHINEAFTISSGWMGELQEQDIVWGENVKRADDRNAVIENLRTTAFSYKELFENIFSMSEDSTATIHKGDQVGGYKLLYWPSALIITICRLTGIGFVPTLFFGRLVNLLLYAFLSMLAIKYVPYKKSIFALVGILPMSMHLAASFSRDALTIAVYMFVVAYTLYLIDKSEKITLRNIIVLLTVSLLAIPAKIIYAPLILLLLLLPKDKFMFFQKKISEKHIRWARILFVVLGIVIFVLAALPFIRTTLRQPADPSLAVHPDDVRYTLPYILTHLVDVIYLTLNTFFDSIAFYLNSLVGGNLGYYNIAIDWTYVVALYLLLLIALIPEKGKRRISKPVRRMGFALSILCALLVVYSCLNWTPLHYTFIYGIQGRYFLPILPLVLCCTSDKITKIKTVTSLDKPLVFTGFSLASLVAFNAFLVILER